MNSSLKFYFDQAQNLSIDHQWISRDFDFFLNAIGIASTTIALKDDLEISSETISSVNNFFTSYVEGIPLDYILNVSEFMGYEFYVDPRVLIPRPETELIVDWVLDLSLNKNSTILEAGTGSGCIAISICLKNKNLKILATDISDEALEVAVLNREKHHAYNVTIIQSNWMSCLRKNSLDLVISNPPYLKPNDAHLEDLQNEPLVALISENGSQGFHDIAIQAMFSLKPGGKIIFEHGYSQAIEVSNILKDYGFNNVVSKKDFQGLDRYTYANK